MQDNNAPSENNLQVIKDAASEVSDATTISFDYND